MRSGLIYSREMCYKLFLPIYIWRREAIPVTIISGCVGGCFISSDMYCTVRDFEQGYFTAINSSCHIQSLSNPISLNKIYVYCKTNCDTAQTCLWGRFFETVCR